MLGVGNEMAQRPATVRFAQSAIALLWKEPANGQNRTDSVASSAERTHSGRIIITIIIASSAAAVIEAVKIEPEHMYTCIKVYVYRHQKERIGAAVRKPSRCGNARDSSFLANDNVGPW